MCAKNDVLTVKNAVRNLICPSTCYETLCSMFVIVGLFLLLIYCCPSTQSVCVRNPNVTIA